MSTYPTEAHKAVAELVDHILTKYLPLPMDLHSEIGLGSSIYYAQVMCDRHGLDYMRAVEAELGRRRPTKK